MRTAIKWMTTVAGRPDFIVSVVQTGRDGERCVECRTATFSQTLSRRATIKLEWKPLVMLRNRFDSKAILSLKSVILDGN